MELNEDENLIAEKLSFPCLVSEEFLRDCHVNLMDFFANPSLYKKPPLPPFTRRQEISIKVSNFRHNLAERLYELVSGHEVPDDDERDY